MARKLFISVLGTGLYEKSVYTQGDFKSRETRFIQQATLELIGCKENWTEEDRVCILLTDKAKVSNWEVSSRKHPHTKEEIAYEGLNTLLQRMNLRPQIMPVSICDGKNEDEMWKIFQTTFELIQDGDELYFDLTHSFRYLPMLILVLGNYAKFLKNIRIAHISYGNYEARNEEGSPIVDLLPLTVLQDWTFAAADFLHNGRSEQLTQLTQQVFKPILRETRGEDQQAQALRKFSDALNNITDKLQMCRGLNITKDKDICRLKMSINQLSEDIIVPLVPVVKRIEQSFTNFIPDSNILNGLHAAQWCYDNHMYQQAITILQETIVTYICSNYGLPVTDIDARTLVNNAFYIIHNKLQQNEEKWKLSNYGKKEEALNKVRELIKLPNIEKLSNSFQTATDVRNDFNHAGFRPNPMSADKLAHKIKESIKEVHNIIFGDYVHQPL